MLELNPTENRWGSVKEIEKAIERSWRTGIDLLLTQG